MNRLTSTVQRSAINAVAVNRMGRKMRRPDHDFNLRFRPFILQPMAIAPVLPGETLKNALCQYSAMSDPIKNPLIGWWMYQYLFYVPFRAMDNISSHLQTMALDPAFGTLNAAADVAADADFYHANASDPSFAYHALKAVTEEFFRDDGEDWQTNAHLDNIPQIGLSKSRAFQSTIMDSQVGTLEPDQMPGDYDADGELGGILGSGASAFADHYDAYQALVAAKLTDVTYEDFLASYGVEIPPKPSDEPLPELLRVQRAWAYPSNAVDESDGSLASALKWRDTWRADKARFFKEPGVLLAVCSVVPKVYFSKQTQSVIDSMQTALDWMPAVLSEQAFTSLKMFTSNGTNAGNGPLGFTPSADYWIDLRDLMVHGDQFVNFALTETDAGLVALPNASAKARFVSSTDADNLFSAASPANKIRMEGVLRLSIASRVMDHTP